MKIKIIVHNYFGTFVQLHIDIYNGNYNINMDYVAEYAHKDMEDLSAEERSAFVGMLYVIDKEDYNTLEQIISVSYTELSTKDSKDYVYDKNDPTCTMQMLYTVEMSDVMKDSFLSYYMETSELCKNGYSDDGNIAKSGLFMSVLNYQSEVKTYGVSLYSDKMHYDTNEDISAFTQKDVCVDFNAFNGLGNPIKLSSLTDELNKKSGKDSEEFNGYKVNIIQNYDVCLEEEERENTLYVYGMRKADSIDNARIDGIADKSTSTLESYKEDVNGLIQEKALEMVGDYIPGYSTIMSIVGAIETAEKVDKMINTDEGNVVETVDGTFSAYNECGDIIDEIRGDDGESDDSSSNDSSNDDSDIDNDDSKDGDDGGSGINETLTSGIEALGEVCDAIEKNKEIDEQVSAINSLAYDSETEYANACVVSGQVVYNKNAGSMELYNISMNENEFRWRAVNYKIERGKDITASNVYTVFEDPNATESDKEKVEKYKDWYVAKKKLESLSDTWYFICIENNIDMNEYNTDNFSDEALQEMVRCYNNGDIKNDFDISVLE